MTQVPSESSYIKFLPSPFHEAVSGRERPLIERYLKIFEKILSGIDDEELGGKKSIGQMLDIVPELFHPRFSFLFKDNATFLPPIESSELEIIKKYFGSENWEEEQARNYLNEFLTSFASWLALILREDWGLEKKREVIARIIPIYRMRGTKKGIAELLKIYVGGNVEVSEPEEILTVGSSTIGINTWLGVNKRRPDYFTVKATFEKVPEQGELPKFVKNIKNLLDLEKPVHTEYRLIIATPTIRIGDRDRSIIGRNTLIGNLKDFSQFEISSKHNKEPTVV